MSNKIITEFDNWMANTIQSIHYVNMKEMDYAHERLLKQSSEDDRSKDKNNVNRASETKVFRIFRNPFKK